MAIPGWMRYVWAGTSDDGTPLALQDPLKARLQKRSVASGTAPSVVRNLLSVTEIFGTDLPADVSSQRALTEYLSQLTAGGVLVTVRHALRRGEQ